MNELVDRLCDEDLERLAEVLAPKIARELGDLDAPASHRWLTAAELAELLGLSRTYVYEHQAELGGEKLGASPKSPLRFKLRRAEDWMTAHRDSERSPNASGA